MGVMRWLEIRADCSIGGQTARPGGIEACPCDSAFATNIAVTPSSTCRCLLPAVSCRQGETREKDRLAGYFGYFLLCGLRAARQFGRRREYLGPHGRSPHGWWHAGR